MYAAKEYVSAIKKQKAEWFILSAGGNDMAHALEAMIFLHRHDPQRPIQECISPSGHDVLKKITTQYNALLAEVRIASPTIKVLCYSYDYAQPEVGQGEYIGRHLKNLSYPPETWDPVVKHVINELTASIRAGIAHDGGVTFLDCRDVAVQYPWWDDCIQRLLDLLR